MTRRRPEMQDWLQATLERGYELKERRIEGWLGVDAATVHESVVALTTGGAAVLFGVTRDGGAMSLVILVGEQKYRWYEADSDVMTQILTRFAESYAKALKSS